MDIYFGDIHFTFPHQFTTFLWQTNTCVNRTTNEASNTKNVVGGKVFPAWPAIKIEAEPVDLRGIEGFG